MQPLHTSLKQWRPPVPNVSPLDAIRSFWPTLVGLHIARNAFPSAIEGESLIITTCSGTWSQQLGFLEARLIPKLQELPEAKVLTRLIFRVGSVNVQATKVAPVRRALIQGRLNLTMDPIKIGTIEELSARIAKQLEERQHRLARTPRCRKCTIPLRMSGLCALCYEREVEMRQRQVQCVLREGPWLGVNAVREMVPGLRLEEFTHARRSLQSRMKQQIAQICWELRKGRAANSSERALVVAYTLLVTGVTPETLCDGLIKHTLGGLIAKLFYPEEQASACRTKLEDEA